MSKAETARLWKENNKERVREINRLSAKRRREENPERHKEIKRRYHLKKKYGITPEDYDLMVRSRGGKCDICRMVSVLVIDHDHLTGIIRGLLCSSCNAALGIFNDDINVLTEAIEYLQAFKDCAATVVAV